MHRAAAIALSVALAGCSETSEAPVCDAADDFEHCSPDELEAAVADLGGKQDGLLTYRSEYVNVVLVGATELGEDVVAILGTHSVDYPYVGGEPWDNILLQVGDRALSRTDVAIEGLQLSGFPDDAEIVLDDTLFDDDGDPVAVQLRWSLQASSSPKDRSTSSSTGNRKPSPPCAACPRPASST